METTRNIQTAFRFREDLVLRLKKKARMKQMSINAYVEKVLEKDLEEDSGKYETIMNELQTLRLSDCLPVTSPGIKVSEKELEQDERMKYILEK